MRIFLDTRDLINVLEKDEPCSVEQFRDWLSSHKHSLVVSPVVVFELAAPLVDATARSNVTRLLNNLESLSLEYVADGFIAPMEIREAISAFTSQREYATVDPYVARLDHALEAFGPLATRMYLNFPLSEIVWTLSQEAPSIFQKKSERLARFRRMLTDDRKLGSSISVTDFFGVKLARDLRTYGIPEPVSGVESIATWIWEAPIRCPALRLDYEVYHQIRRNTKDRGYLQDFEDLAHVKCVPYVDRATLDRRMTGYVRQVSRDWNDSPGVKLSHNLREIMADSNPVAV